MQTRVPLRTVWVVELMATKATMCSTAVAKRCAAAIALLLLCPVCVLALKDTKFYKALDIAPDADDASIKKAYRKQALKWHPDR